MNPAVIPTHMHLDLSLLKSVFDIFVALRYWSMSKYIISFATLLRPTIPHIQKHSTMNANDPQSIII